MRRSGAFLVFCVMLLAAGLCGCNSEPPMPPGPGLPDGGRPSEAGVATWDQAKRTIVLSNGITLAYVEAGDPDGETVILLHGYTDTSRSFQKVLETLDAGGTALHLFALDQRGHGKSSMPAGADCPRVPETCFDPASLAEDVFAFMEALGIERAHIVGHSMGSLVAQELALADPGRILSLMLIGTFVSGDNPTFRDFLVPLVDGGNASEGQWRGMLEGRRPALRWPDDAYELTPIDADPGAREFMATVWVADPTADAAFLAQIVPETTATRLGTWIGAVRAQRAFDSRSRLSELTVPTLVIWATQDSLFPAPEQQRVRAALDTAVEECNLERYHYKTYGKAPLPASGMQESDIGHNVQWSADVAIAADLTEWVTTGAPTTDLPYAAPANPSRIINDPDSADVTVVRQADGCST